MYHTMYPCPYPVNAPLFNSNNLYTDNKMSPCPYYPNAPMYSPNAQNPYSPQFNNQYPSQMNNLYPTPYLTNSNNSMPGNFTQIKDYGPEPLFINIEEVTKQNNTFRTALWTGKHLQVTLMSINVGEDIGLEVHPNLDQFIRIEEGQGLAVMGDSKDNLNIQQNVYDDFVIIVPAGKWHNLINTGYKPLKLYSIYAPPEHPHGTVHETKAIAEASEAHHDH